MSAPLGALEAGGTKFVCAAGTGPDDLAATARIPTSTPDETIGAVIAFFDDHPVRSLGVASFGPVELRRGHADYGHITATPKPGWPGTDLIGRLRDALGVPIGFDTDVNGAALAEGRWGAAAGCDSFVYLTVGTGVGGGAVVGGRLAHGLVHPEMGHLYVGRLPGDDFAGACPYHGDCLEGMAAGPALEARWGAPAEQLSGAILARAVRLEAEYLAAGLRNIVYTVAPERIVLGGGVSQLPGLLAALRGALADELAGYPGLPEHADASFVTPSSLPAAGLAGALLLAEDALRE